MAARKTTRNPKPARKARARKAPAAKAAGAAAEKKVAETAAADQADEPKSPATGDADTLADSPPVEPAPPEGAGKETAQTVTPEPGGAKQPDGETDPPPVSVPVLVVKGPKKGRRRAAFYFGSEPVEITPGQLGDDVEAARRLLAILSDP
ncbi:MAG: hypothetical protein KUG65_06075, partial [Sphingomonadaceae bacterium]|nr:hypothetical protein [Sphingomonadaceae bacterium]